MYDKINTSLVNVNVFGASHRWKIARGRSGRYIIGKMVEYICLVDIEGIHITYLNQAYSVLYQSPSQAKDVFCNTDLEL